MFLVATLLKPCLFSGQQVDSETILITQNQVLVKSLRNSSQHRSNVRFKHSGPYL